MDLLSATQLPGDLARAGEVVGVLIKYGLAEWLKTTGWEPARRMLTSHTGEVLTDQSFATRVRLALTDLGTTFVKLGQVLSTRPDLVGDDVALELKHLQAGTPADDPDVARATIEAELGRTLAECFKEFDPVALASASIGQAHVARLHNNRKVIVKVQHPGIEAVVQRDLRILSNLATLAETRDELRRYQPVEVVREFRQTMLRELDFRREMRNLQQFRQNFREDPTVVFPRPYPEFTTSRVLTMQFLKGVSVGNLPVIEEMKLDPGELARRGADVYIEMIFRDGLYHADPHPGNILAMRDGRIGMLDAGMVGRVDASLRDDIAEALMAAADHDSDRLTEVIIHLCRAPDHLDRAGLSAELMELFTQFGSQSVDQFDVSGALINIMRLIREYHLRMPSRLSMLIKCLIMLEGTGKALSPQFNLASVLEPHRRRFVMQQYSPKAKLRKARQLFRDWERVAEMIPRDITMMLDRIRGGRFSLNLKHSRLETTVNRLVYGLFTSALLLSSALLWSRSVPPLIFGVPIVAVLGYAAALGLGARMLWKTRKS